MGLLLGFPEKNPDSPVALDARLRTARSDESVATARAPASSAVLSVGVATAAAASVWRPHAEPPQKLVNLIQS